MFRFSYCYVYVFFVLCVFCSVYSVFIVLFWAVLCANVHCTTATQLQLTNISYGMLFPPKFLEGFIFLISVYILSAARISAFFNYISPKTKFGVKVNVPLHMSGRKAGGVEVQLHLF